MSTRHLVGTCSSARVWLRASDLASVWLRHCRRPSQRERHLAQSSSSLRLSLECELPAGIELGCRAGSRKATFALECGRGRQVVASVAEECGLWLPASRTYRSPVRPLPRLVVVAAAAAAAVVVVDVATRAPPSPITSRPMSIASRSSCSRACSPPSVRLLRRLSGVRAGQEVPKLR